MARRSISIEEKIERQKKIVFQAKDKYDAALAELDRLQQKKKALQNEDLIIAMEKSECSFDEIMAFLKDEQE